MRSDSFSEEAFNRGEYHMTAEEKAIAGSGLPVALVMNKCDLITNKRRMRGLQSELEDLCRFDQVFHVSCETGFGIEALKEYMISNALPRDWMYDPSMVSKKSPVERAEEAMK
jgi:GTPase Era involved in 16S rRNA processing